MENMMKIRIDRKFWYFLWKESLSGAGQQSININKTNKYLSRHTIEHKQTYGVEIQ